MAMLLGARHGWCVRFRFWWDDAHAVLAQFDPADYDTNPQPVEPQLADGTHVLLPVSGLLPSRRRQAAADMADFLEGRSDDDLITVARSLARRNHGRSSAVVDAGTVAEAVKRLRLVADGKKGPGIAVADSPATTGPVFVYSGFGSQHRKMAKELVAMSPLFKARLEELDEFIKFESGWSLMELIADDSPNLRHGNRAGGHYRDPDCPDGPAGSVRGDTRCRDGHVHG